MNPCVGSRSTGHHHWFAEENSKCFFDFFLDGTGIGLYLEPAVGGAFIGDFQKITGHAQRYRRGIMTVYRPLQGICAGNSCPSAYRPAHENDPDRRYADAPHPSAGIWLYQKRTGGQQPNLDSP